MRNHRKDQAQLREEILNNPFIKIEIVRSKIDVYNDIAFLMVERLKENNLLSKPTSFILPVGPRGQYRRFARICNRQKISCKDLTTINMDEYLDDELKYIDIDSPFSFRSFMQKNLFELLDKGLKMKKDNMYFPDPEKKDEISDLIAELGGADICFGGVGINGHIAFNEPVSDGSMSVDKYRKTKTRIIKLTRDTIVINSLKYGGDTDLMPQNAISIGMDDILRSKSLKFYMEHDWQAAVLRKAVFEESSPSFPVTYLKEHENATITISENVLDNYISIFS